MKEAILVILLFSLDTSGDITANKIELTQYQNLQVCMEAAADLSAAIKRAERLSIHGSSRLSNAYCEVR